MAEGLKGWASLEGIDQEKEEVDEIERMLGQMRRSRQRRRKGGKGGKGGLGDRDLLFNEEKEKEGMEEGE